jgi:hypothetical protein
LVAGHNLGSTNIDDLDSAHHIMDGIFFRDVLVDLPLAHPINYTVEYYKKYPALGFLYWPPVFPVVEGVAFLIAGINVQVSRICVLLFGIVAGMAFYAIMASYGRFCAVCGSIFLMSAPLVGRYLNQVMLEIPAIAMGLLTVALYFRLREEDSIGWRDGVLFAVTAAAAAYTKQTIAFVYAAIVCDVMVNHRRLLRQPRFYIVIGLLVMLLLPLAAFTLIFGKSNIEVSVGNDTGYLKTMYAFHALDRWTIAAWTFYPKLLPGLLNPLVLLFGVAGVAYALANRAFFRANCLWLAWIAIWYVVFSYFLNRQDRYAILWLPGWAALAVALLGQLHRWLTPRGRVIVLTAALVAVALTNGAQLRARTQVGFSGMEPIVRPLMDSGTNIAYLGDHRQLFVPYVRKFDKHQRIYTLQLDDIVQASGNLSEAVYRYKIRYLLIERPAVPSPEAESFTRQISADPRFHELATGSIQTWPRPFAVHVYQYAGPQAASMAAIPLQSSLVGEKGQRLVN